MNARELRSLLFEIDNQNMTVKELREYLYVIQKQDAELEIGQIRQLGKPIVKVQKKQQSEHAQTAKAIRAELKQAFPTIKFFVKSDRFAGGNSVDVNWSDGPTVKEIDAIIGKYQYGKFDGMQDMYENSNVRNDIPQVKYVQTSRKCSAVAANLIINKLGIENCTAEDNGFGGYSLTGNYSETFDYYKQIHREFYKNAY